MFSIGSYETSCVVIGDFSKDLMDLKADLYESKERNKDLEDRVCEAEEAAKEKAEELSDVIQRLRKDKYDLLAWSWFSVLQLITYGQSSN